MGRFFFLGLLMVLGLSLGVSWSFAQENRSFGMDPVSYDIPRMVHQGEVIPIVIRHGSSRWAEGKAVLANKTVPLFLENTGDVVGLMPIGVDHPLGRFSLVLWDAAHNLSHTSTVKVLDAHFPIQNIQVSKATGGLQPLPGEMEAIMALKNRLTPLRYWEEPFVSPTPDCMNSLFGVIRYHNGKPAGDYHKGVDLRSPMGRPIKATAGGRVFIAKMFRLHGGTVGLDHGQGVTSIYIHMSKLAVAEGALVKKGDVIGYVGSTGFATGPHLHWGLYVNGVPVNPSQWVPHVPKCL